MFSHYLSESGSDCCIKLPSLMCMGDKSLLMLALPVCSLFLPEEPLLSFLNAGVLALRSRLSVFSLPTRYSVPFLFRLTPGSSMSPAPLWCLFVTADCVAKKSIWILGRLVSRLFLLYSKFDKISFDVVLPISSDSNELLI